MPGHAEGLDVFMDMDGSATACLRHPDVTGKWRQTTRTVHDCHVGVSLDEEAGAPRTVRAASQPAKAGRPAQPKVGLVRAGGWFPLLAIASWASGHMAVGFEEQFMRQTS